LKEIQFIGKGEFISSLKYFANYFKISSKAEGHNVIGQVKYKDEKVTQKLIQAT